MKETFTLRAMEAADWPAVAGIYQAGIDGGNATFQTEVPGWESWNASHLSVCRLVCMAAGELAGWAALAPTSSRPAYRGAVEVSIYVSPAFARQGVGQRLLERLIRQSEDAGCWTLCAGIFAENIASLALHEKCGFRKIGVREKIAALGGQWKDVVLMERRSRLVGWPRH